MFPLLALLSFLGSVVSLQHGQHHTQQWPRLLATQPECTCSPHLGPPAGLSAALPKPQGQALHLHLPLILIKTQSSVDKVKSPSQHFFKE